MASEHAPPPPKVRVTKAQLRQIQKNYQKAQKLATDFSEEEQKEKEKELKKLEKKLDNIEGSGKKDATLNE